MNSYPLLFRVLGKTPLIILDSELTAGSDLNLMKTYNGLKNDFHPASIALDFSNITYINSSGIASLIDIIHDMQSRNGTISFIALSSHLRERLDYLGLLEFVNVYQTDQEMTEAGSAN